MKRHSGLLTGGDGTGEVGNTGEGIYLGQVTQ
jgi:hypothetical protein